MKRKSLLLLITSLLLTVFSINAQKQYVKFAEEPPKRLAVKEVDGTKIAVEFKTRKEATIYVEIYNKNKMVGNSTKTVKSRKPKTIQMSLRKFPKKKIIPGKNYKLKVYMFEGPKGTWKKQLGGTEEVTGITVTRIL